jgi:photosystem II stability/assembly factor-like uncharacterized protein
MRIKIFNWIIASLVITALTYSQTGWFSQSSNTSNNLNAVFFLDVNNGFVVGDAGTFLKTTNGGTNWTASTTTPAVDLNDVYFFNLNEGIIAANGGIILRTTNGGSGWNTVTTGVSDNLLSFSFSGSNGICGGTSQTILRTTNSGASWLIVQDGFFGGGFWGAFMLDANTGFVAGENSIFQPMVGRSTNSGVNWDFFPFYLNTNEGRLFDIHFFDNNNGVTAAGVWNGTGAISRTTNGGTDWMTTLFSQPFYGLNFPNSSTGYTVGYNGVIYKSTNSGVSWNSQNSGTGNTLNDVFFVNEIVGSAVGENGTILKTIDGGIPVELTSFTYNLSGSKVTLNWETASEINNRGFEVERSQKSSRQRRDKIQNEWESIGFVEGKGTTTEKQTYSFTDDLRNLNISDKIYYRLKQIDFDGTFEYSNELEVDYSQVPDNYSLSQNYPNPFNPTTTIKFSLPEPSLVSIKVYNVIGKEVMILIDEFKPKGNYEIEMNGFELTSGVYFYKMTAGNYTDTKRMLLIK